LVLLVQATNAQQDVFNLENSRRFANYLYESGQFDLASDEYERVVFMSPADSVSLSRLLGSYRQQKAYDTGVKRAFDLIADPGQTHVSVFNEMFSLCLLSGQYGKGHDILSKRKDIRELKRHQYELGLLLLEGKHGDALAYASDNDPGYDETGEALKKLLMQYRDLPSKSPWLSALLSAVIPGTGKIYTGDWQDGLISMLFVSTNAWQSYRGFRNDGIRSAYGWVFGTIATGFWAGNIYGSYRAAKKFNQRQSHHYHEMVERTVLGSR